MPIDTTALVNTAITLLPEVFGLIRARHMAEGQIPPTDDEVKAALAQAVASSIAVDERWLAQHPSA